MGTNTATQKPLVLDRITYELTGEPFEHLARNGIPKALEKTLNAGRLPATLPELVQYRTNNHDPRLWNSGFTTMSEEDVGPNAQRIKLNTTDPVYALAHGDAAILTTPERIRKALEAGLTSQYAARFEEPEFNLMLSGHDGQFPVLTIDEFVEETATNPHFGHQTRSYVVVAPFAQLQHTPSGYEKIADLRRNELVHVRAGGKAQANAFLDVASKVYNTKKFGNCHRFMEITPQERQGRVLFLDDDDNCGFVGDYILGGLGRFLGVAPEAQGARTSAVITPTLEQVLTLSELVSPDKQEEFEKRARSFCKA